MVGGYVERRVPGPNDPFEETKMAIGLNSPGAPGIPPRWTSSAKSGVGTALSPASAVWFTISRGILNEIYYPRIDRLARGTWDLW